MRVTSKLIVFNGTQLLLLKKKTSETKFSLLGGGVKKKESPVEAVLREASEEGSIELDVDNLKYYKSILINNEEVVNYYVINNVQRFQLLEPHKFAALEWVEFNYALTKMRKSDRAIIVKYIKKWRKK